MILECNSRAEDRQLVQAVVAIISALLLAGCGHSTSNGDPSTANAAPKPWEPVQVNEEYVPTPQAIASEIVKFDIAVLRPPTNKRLLLMLPNGQSTVVVIAKFEESSPSRFVWRGSIENETGSDVRFAVVNDTLVGEIVSARGRLYTVRTIKTGLAVIEELDPLKFPREEGPDRPDLRDESSANSDRQAENGSSNGSQQARRRSFLPHSLAEVPGRSNLIANPQLVQAPPVQEGPQYILRETKQVTDESDTDVDVLVLYTAGALNYLNVPDGVDAKLLLIISDANNSYSESGINLHINSVHVEQTDYQESGDLYLDWKALKRKGNGTADGPQFGDLKSKRLSYGADIVALLTSAVSASNANSCGQAGQMHDVVPETCAEAYAVIPSNCAATQYSFIHELGHVMGADHNENEDQPTNSPPFDHSRGYIAQSNSWRTIMALPKDACSLPECQRIRRWSNPALTFGETPIAAESPPLIEATGIPSTNNALALNDTRSAVAAFSDTCK
jgi:metallopeptidase family M12-like protein